MATESSATKIFSIRRSLASGLKTIRVANVDSQRFVSYCNGMGFVTSVDAGVITMTLGGVTMHLNIADIPAVYGDLAELFQHFYLPPQGILINGIYYALVGSPTTAAPLLAVIRY
jgi:hypothetical protein